MLRSFQESDIPRMVEYCGDMEVARNLLLVPFPYSEGDARAWLSQIDDRHARNEVRCFAVTLSSTGELIGSMGLKLALQHRKSELGYWFGPPHWGKGYATEAARAVVGYAFEDLGCERVSANYFHWNPASGRVLEKIGMRREGVLRRSVVRLGQVADEIVMSVLRGEWGDTTPGACA